MTFSELILDAHLGDASHVHVLAGNAVLVRVSGKLREHSFGVSSSEQVHQWGREIFGESEWNEYFNGGEGRPMYLDTSVSVDEELFIRVSAWATYPELPGMVVALVPKSAAS